MGGKGAARAAGRPARWRRPTLVAAVFEDGGKPAVRVLHGKRIGDDENAASRDGRGRRGGDEREEETEDEHGEK